jgi:hypothetical protein
MTTGALILFAMMTIAVAGYGTSDGLRVADAGFADRRLRWPMLRLLTVGRNPIKPRRYVVVVVTATCQLASPLYGALL